LRVIKKKTQAGKEITRGVGVAASAAGVEVCSDAAENDSTDGAGDCTAGGAGRRTGGTGVELRGSICVWGVGAERGVGAGAGDGAGTRPEVRGGSGASVAKDAARARANASSFEVSSPAAAWLVSFKNENPEGAGAAVPPPLCIAIPEKSAPTPGEFVATAAAAMRGWAASGTGPARSDSQRSSASEVGVLHTALAALTALTAEPCGAGGGGGE